MPPFITSSSSSVAIAYRGVEPLISVRKADVLSLDQYAMLVHFGLLPSSALGNKNLLLLLT